MAVYEAMQAGVAGDRIFYRLYHSPAFRRVLDDRLKKGDLVFIGSLGGVNSPLYAAFLNQPYFGVHIDGRTGRALVDQKAPVTRATAQQARSAIEAALKYAEDLATQLLTALKVPCDADSDEAQHHIAVLHQSRRLDRNPLAGAIVDLAMDVTEAAGEATDVMPGRAVQLIIALFAVCKSVALKPHSPTPAATSVLAEVVTAMAGMIERSSESEQVRGKPSSLSDAAVRAAVVAQLALRRTPLPWYCGDLGRGERHPRRWHLPLHQAAAVVVAS